MKGQQKVWKVIVLEVKIKIKYKVIEKLLVNFGIIDFTVIYETLDLQLEKSS